MRKILTRYQVDPTFLPVLFSFGEVPHLAESGSSNMASPMQSDGSQSKQGSRALSRIQNVVVGVRALMMILKKSHTRSDMRKRTIDRPTGPGLSDRRASTITTPPMGTDSISSSCFIRSRIVFSSSKWSVLRRCRLPLWSWRVSCRIRTVCTSCRSLYTWIIGDGTLGI